MGNVTAYLTRKSRSFAGYILGSIRTFKIFSANRFRNRLAISRPSHQDVEALRTSFNTRYRHFRNLLTANNNALQAMAELEKLYYSGESYRMAEARSKIVAILVNVYKIVRNLREMTSGKYAELESRFEKISDDITTIIESKPSFKTGPFILPLSQISRKLRRQTGDKMANLGEISGLPGITVPQGFVITASATNHFITDVHLAEINRRLQILETDDLEGLYKTCTDLQQMVREIPLPSDLEELLQMQYGMLEKSAPGCLVAMRSSAVGEDVAGVSFAGLYTTILDVDRDHLSEAYKLVIAGKYSPRAIAYRRRRGFRHEDIEMCVGCLVMVDAKVSGVAYSSYPIGYARQKIRIVATPGLAKGVVDGTNSSDIFLANRQPPYAAVHSEDNPDSIEKRAESRGNPLLSQAQLQELCEKIMLLEDHFKCPQDIEWSFDGREELHILQCRPIAQNNEETAKEKSKDSTVTPESETAIIKGGVCAGDGIASGKVFKVFTSEDAQRFPHDAVLAVEYPLPEWAPLLNRASAILAENGTEAGHLATVAREFSMPALFSLADIMRNLENGQTITVDSSAKRIYQGCRKDLLTRKRPRRDLMAGSPVQRILTEALQYISPLNLNDPTSHYFKVTWCETLHDITRYCHEKSVSEMFNFGEKINFDRGMAKRLVADIPLQWWVINLADGFRRDIDEAHKNIDIKDIVSEPMLAIWQGISAYPWQGPPSLTTRGLGAIILQSAMRPDLDPAVASKLTVKNYFLIAKNYCNLSLRLGYHYAMIESYISDFLTESYITFRFKGGAADMRRKAVRARLLAEILQEFGFRVELRSDALLARLKKQPRDYLLKRLQVLGYLSLHTRQIDMVMDQQDSVARYKSRFLREINEMLAFEPTPPGGADHG